jgi:hypothetical protein
MLPDGNCFFRSVADQLEGACGCHEAIRKQVSDHMEANPDMYAPFMEFDETLDSYIARMRKVRIAAPYVSHERLVNMTLCAQHQHSSADL